MNLRQYPYFCFLVQMHNCQLIFLDHIIPRKIQLIDMYLLRLYEKFNDINVWLNDSAVFLTIYIFIMFQYVYVSFLFWYNFGNYKKTVYGFTHHEHCLILLIFLGFHCLGCHSSNRCNNQHMF